MPRKITYEEVKSYIESFIGYILLSKEYKNSQTKLQIQCPEGHVFWMTYNSFQRGRRCPECYNNKKSTYEEIKWDIELKGYKLLSEKHEYKNVNTVLKMQCPEEHICFVRYSDFQRGHRCSICTGKKKWSHEGVKIYIESFIGYILLSKEYKNNKTKLQIQCPEGHVFWMTYNSFQRGCRCPECYGNKKLTHKEVKSYIESFAGHILISKEYKNVRTKLEIRCPEGHIFWMSYGKFQRGHRCPYCYGNKKLTNQEIIDKLSFCEDIRETDQCQVEVKCAYCGGWHIPQKRDLLCRIRYIDGRENKESRLYCSQQCKDECPIYGQISYPKGFTKDAPYTESQLYFWRKAVLERENYTCEYCEEPANTAHHEYPKKPYPELALEPDNGIACCMKCHFDYGHEKGTECSTGNLAHRV